MCGKDTYIHRWYLKTLVHFGMWVRRFPANFLMAQRGQNDLGAVKYYCAYAGNFAIL